VSQVRPKPTQKTSRIESRVVISSPVPQHPAYGFDSVPPSMRVGFAFPLKRYSARGIVQGGSNQTRTFGSVVKNDPGALPPPPFPHHRKFGSVLDSFISWIDSNGIEKKLSIMARQLRFQYAGAVYHVMARKNMGQS
jgi:hypothetical protein